MRMPLFVMMVVLLASARAPRAAQTGPHASVLEAGRRAVSGGTTVTDLRSLVVHGHRRVLIGLTGRLSEPRPVEIRIPCLITIFG